jgi:excinuclease ABC subunit A
VAIDNNEFIRVRGAKEHNLKNINVDIPRNSLTVITGLSGSGKSSLAFDTIYAEGQRRYVDSLSTYARQFMERLKKPNVDSISGLSPTIAIDQKSVGLNPRSTVGTVTELYDYLRLLFAKVGVPHCPTHKTPVTSQHPGQIVDDIMSMPPGTQFILLAPVVQGRKGEFLAEFQKWSKKGFVQAKVDGQYIELAQAKKLVKTKTHDIDIVVDKLVVKPEFRLRLAESVNTAIGLADGKVAIEMSKTKERRNFSIHSTCAECGFNFPELEPRFFSFNNPRGACETCTGLGTLDIIEISDTDSDVSGSQNRRTTGAKYKLANEKKSTGSSDDDDSTVDEFSLKVCPDCKGSRLRLEARHVLIGGKNISELAALAAQDLKQTLLASDFNSNLKIISDKILKQLDSRLDFLLRVGAGYLSLDRSTRTLSGGEAQRIRLASQVGSALIGILYILDEPSIGLHPRDHHRLLEILREIRDLGNTVVLVEHDEDTIRMADYIIDIGPRAGRLGGALIASGTPAEIIKSKDSTTGKYLSRQLKIPVPSKRRKGTGKKIVLSGASGNNLKNITVSFPLGTFIAVTGVSGSGKSTLIMDTLYRALSNQVYKSGFETPPFKSLTGAEAVDKVVHINQNPIGRTPRSTPATYVGLFPLVRDLYAALPESKIRGHSPGRFSFNVKGGRCENCQGAGMVRLEMHFMADVFVECDVCLGLRYNRETLAIKYKDKSIADVLSMSVEEAMPFFTNHQMIYRKLETLHQVGLDYITLGQASTTLSGGEAQRVKLSKELSKRSTGKTFYILDEPTTGLHFADTQKLVELLHTLVDQENTVLVIEHNMDVVKAADFVIDMGIEGGRLGGELIASGSPEEIAKSKVSLTAPFLAQALAGS